MDNTITKELASNIKFNNVNITDRFFGYYQNLIINEVIPYQWKVLNDELEGVEKSSAIKNFKIAAKEIEGNFYGFIFQDSDVYKWLEAVAYSLHLKENKELERCADEVIDLIGRAQQDDGYLHTYFIIERPDMKFKDLWECHELYCAGHFFEAATAYYNATRKEKVIEIAKKLADCIYNNFGVEEGKIKGYDGHEEVELGLMSLYSVTKEKRYLDLAKFFIDERGQSPHFFEVEWEARGKTSYWNGWNPCESPNASKDFISCIGAEYNQTHKPVREQDEAVGHAVRVVYMLCGMIDVARESKDNSLLEACQKLWNNIVNQKMYITGAIGSTHVGEAFTGNYDLPNDSLYGETCASIGLAMAAKRMLNTEINSKYSDVIEKEIYNGIISGIAMDGKSFFYVNPLEVYPKNHTNPVLEQVKVERQKWYPCACCPPNVARFLLNIGDYIYSSNNDTVYIHQYIANNSRLNIGESFVNIEMKCDLLKSQEIEIKIGGSDLENKNIALRIPSWSSGHSVKIFNNEADYEIINGYIYLRNIPKNDISIYLSFNSELKVIKANKRVRYDAGKVAITYGPLVYCTEEIDNGDMLYNLLLKDSKNFEREAFTHNDLELFKIIVDGYREIDNDDSLYHENNITLESEKITLVPYHYWGNRGIGEMQVWFRIR